jgi:two-component system NtrC family sensor kinase
MINTAMINTSPYYRALTRKMVLIVIVVSFTPMILVTGIILNHFSVSHHEKVYAHLGELVQKHKQNIDNFLQEKLNEIMFLADTFSYSQFSDESFLNHQLASLRRNFGTVFVDLGVVENSGRQAAYAGPFKLEKANYADSHWFEQALKRRTYISDVFLGLRGMPHFIIAVRNRFADKPWILRATIDFVSFNNLVENVRVGETGFAYILNRAGQFQTKPLVEFSPGKGCYGHFFSCEEPAAKGIRISERQDESGRKSIYVTALLKNDDWLLVYKQVSSDAFSDLRNTQRIAVIIFIVGGMAIIVMAFWLSKRMVERIARADKEKEMMNQQVIETGKLASLGELAAGISHEINNPVAIMVEEAGWIEDLLEEEDLKQSKNLDEFIRALKQINTQGQRCKEITLKLLSFARKTDSRVHLFQINDLIADVVALSAQRAKFGKVEIETDLSPNLPEIEASLSEMQQVFLNLINNALDAMEKRGGHIKITSYPDNGNVQIQFADDGPGIPRSNLSRIFDPFYTTKPVCRGT